ncbi:MAG: TetR family transcriptional regulator [Gammaproteobacteria bacterium]|nr:TetR family transcriptional regulator [Gammaproteobacteria bacterium]
MGKAAASTRKRILDAAEKLFADRGFHGVSVREIAREAGVDVALVSYHCGRKNDLFETVFLRRAEMLNEERLQMLAACRQAAAPDSPSLEAIIDAFTHPLLNRSARGSAGWKRFFALVAQVNNSPELAPIGMTKFFDPLVQEFIAALRDALPGAREEDIYWSYHFLSGALTLTFAETGRIDKLSGGVCRSSDLDSVHERLVPYAAAGFRRLCAPAQTTAAAKPARTRGRANGPKSAPKKTSGKRAKWPASKASAKKVSGKAAAAKTRSKKAPAGSAKGAVRKSRAQPN